jgi:hypothetical protein
MVNFTGISDYIDIDITLTTGDTYSNNDIYITQSNYDSLQEEMEQREREEYQAELDYNKKLRFQDLIIFNQRKLKQRNPYYSFKQFPLIRNNENIGIRNWKKRKYSK